MSTTTGPLDVGSELDRLRQRLIAQAELFDSPTNYASGVLDTLDAVAHLLHEEDAATRPAV